MRRLGIVVLTGMLLTFGLAGNASALGIMPEELDFNTGGVEGRLFVVSIDRGMLTLGLDVENGQISGINLKLLDPNDPVNVLGAGVRIGPGTRVTDIVVGTDEATFSFEDFQFGLTSQPFFVDYGIRGPMIGDLLSVTLFTGLNQQLTTLTATVVPEPTTALMLSLGMAGLMFAGRKRRSS